MIEATDFLILSLDLIDSDSPNESKYRTAISRSYYAIYHMMAREYAVAKGLEVEDSVISSHQRFIKELKDDSDAKIKTLGNQLFQLKQAREDADYKLKLDINKSKAKMNYTYAERMQKTINSVFSV
nr:hypothetical protein [Desulfobulbaceae bacterium]